MPSSPQSLATVGNLTKYYWTFGDEAAGAQRTSSDTATFQHAYTAADSFTITLVVADAWTLPGTKRVWLHTSTLDHPNALPNYLRRGFRGFSRPA